MRRITVLLALAVLVVASVAAGAWGRGETEMGWQARRLGAAGGEFWPVAINARGQVVGTGGRAIVRAFLWRDGRMTVLPALDEISEVVGLNNAGLIVGNLQSDSEPHAVLWTLKP